MKSIPQWLGFTVVGIFIGLWWTSQCGGPPSPGSSTIDTVTVERTFWDTLPFYEDTATPEPIVIYRDFQEVEPDSIILTELRDTTLEIYHYTEDISDTLIQGELRIWGEGRLIGAELSYLPLFPEYIIQTKEITKTVTVQKRGMQIWVDAELGINSPFQEVGITFVDKNHKFKFGPRYGNFDGTQYFGVEIGYRLFEF